MACQYPNCSRTYYAICSNHCHWSLCEEHTNEHRRSLATELEHVLNDIVEPTGQLTRSIERKQLSLREQHRHELLRLEQLHKRNVDRIEQRLKTLQDFQNQFQEKSKHAADCKRSQDTLTASHFQQLDALVEQFQHSKNACTGHPRSLHHCLAYAYVSDVSPVRLNGKTRSSVQNPLSSAVAHWRYKSHHACPLTSLDVFGLNESHNVRLCAPHKAFRQLFEHLRNYHHLSIDYANRLIQAMAMNEDPTSTIIFPSDTTISVIDEKRPCPLHATPATSGIRCTPCTTTMIGKLFRSHLCTVHRLSASRIDKVLEEAYQ